MARQILFASELGSRRGALRRGVHLTEGVGVFAGNGSLARLPVVDRLDLVALDRDLRVLAVYPNVPPAHTGRVPEGKLLGLCAGAAAQADLRCGDKLELGLY
ncbi:MAG TPA: DUF192 domain-containing protein [Firmicutes bacterium]|nr:DUF192 domain-containing protein [Bacillota bacterium]